MRKNGCKPIRLTSAVLLGLVFRCHWGKHEGFVKYFFRLRSNGKEKRVIFLNFHQPPNTLHIHSSDRERTWLETHCHVCDCRAFSTMVNPRGKTINNLVKCSARNDSVKTCNSKICAAPSLCQRSNVVYIATRVLCGQDYIGMTARKLHDRAREHTFSARKKDDKTALGEHNRDCHTKVEKPSIAFQIIKHQPDLLHLNLKSHQLLQCTHTSPALTFLAICPLVFPTKKPSKPHSDHRSIPDQPTGDGVVHRNVLKSLPTFPPDIYYQYENRSAWTCWRSIVWPH